MNRARKSAEQTKEKGHFVAQQCVGLGIRNQRENRGPPRPLKKSLLKKTGRKNQFLKWVEN